MIINRNRSIGKETITWHQCSETVKNFIAYVQSNNIYTRENRFTESVIENYAPSDRPLTLAEIQEFTKPHSKVIDGVSFVNNEPLKVVPFATENLSGTLTFLDKVRWYNTTYSPVQSGGYYPLGTNCRDLGGWDCDGGTVKYGMLIRGGEANPVDKELMVNEIGVKTEICFLPLNKQQFPNESPWGIDRTINWTNDDFMYKIANTSSVPTVIEQWRLYIKAIFESILHGKPVIFHCGAGADKTGTMALMLLAILGVSEQDIDIDYELTEFSESLSEFYRTRKLTEYNDYKSAILEFPLVNGLTDTFRNRCISFILSLGITADEINAFRDACIDGNPETISPILDTYTITKNGGNVSYSNPATSVNEFQEYTTEITPAIRNVITDIKIIMGGVDITSLCFKGERTPFGDVAISENGEFDVSWKSSVNVNVSKGDNVTVTKTLGDSTCDNSQTSVIKGQSFGGKIIPNIGKAISNITVTMDGTDITSSAVTLIN